MTRLRLSLDRVGDTQIVIVRGKRWGHAGLLVEGRRGQGDWEEIGILGGRALRDTRPLAVRGHPEVREYRARFFDGTTEISGDWSPVEGVTVSV